MLRWAVLPGTVTYQMVLNCAGILGTRRLVPHAGWHAARCYTERSVPHGAAPHCAAIVPRAGALRRVWLCHISATTLMPGPRCSRQWSIELP